MTLESDNWPLPKFDAGDAKHLHAVGVISLIFVQFERGIEELFLHHPAQSQIPADLVQRYYYSLSEEQRVKTTRRFYQDYEADPLVRNAAENVLDFFNWAHDARNKILHSERYPASFGGRADTFYLIKRAGKRDPGSIYFSLKLSQLRDIGEKMRAGVVLAAEIRIHLRYRKVDPSAIEESLRAYASVPPSFDLLEIPEKLPATETPQY